MEKYVSTGTHMEAKIPIRVLTSETEVDFTWNTSHVGNATNTSDVKHTHTKNYMNKDSFFIDRDADSEYIYYQDIWGYYCINKYGIKIKRIQPPIHNYPTREFELKTWKKLDDVQVTPKDLIYNSTDNISITIDLSAKLVIPNVPGFDTIGLDTDGFDVNGFDVTGYDRQGYDKFGYDEDGWDIEGFDLTGFIGCVYDGGNKTKFDCERWKARTHWGFEPFQIGTWISDEHGCQTNETVRAWKCGDAYPDCKTIESQCDDNTLTHWIRNTEGFDSNGYNRDGYDKFGYDEDGNKQPGWDNGPYAEDGYNSDGYDRWGFGRDGYNDEGGLIPVNDRDRDGYNRDGFGRDGFNRQGFDSDGYDRDGYNVNGFGRDGWDKFGYDSDGCDRWGFDSDGYDRDGFNADGWDIEGFGRDGYNRDGFGRDGFDSDGYDRDGYNVNGFGRDGFNRDGYDRWGYNANDYNADGFNADGYNVNGFDSDGYDRWGYNSDGYNVNGFDSDGFDSWDYHRDNYVTARKGCINTGEFTTKELCLADRRFSWVIADDGSTHCQYSYIYPETESECNMKPSGYIWVD
jgi:hypothetical protein